MRKASTLVGLILVALGAPGASATAQEAVPAIAAPAPAPVDSAVAAAPGARVPAPAPRQRRIELGLSFLPMAAGRFTSQVASATGPMRATGDASFAYGFALSGSYRIIRGLSVGLAPQAIFNVKDKVNPDRSMTAAPAAGKEYDLMARVAYAFQVEETIALYVEVLPGYSILQEAVGDTAKGFVLGFGGGVAMNVTDLVFANLGVGYQLGFQKLPAADMNAEVRTKYARVALGGGVRF
jgi:hypothetical protein